MKTNKILKVMCIIILILILIMISFVGIYVKDNGRLVNILKDFTTASEFGVEKEYLFSLSDETRTEYYDVDGNLVAEEDVDEDAEEGTYTTKEIALNSDEVKTAENYNLVKDIMEKRINEIGLEEYRLTVDEESGDIVLKTGETFNVDNIINALYGQGEFLLKDAETDEVLLSNNDIKNARVGYYPDTAGTSVYLSINFNKEGKQKLKDISSKYIQTTEVKDVTAEDGTVTQEENEVTKNVKLYVDGELIINTYFGEPIENGQLQLTMGQATTDSEELQNTLLAASVEATKLSHGAYPLIYEATQNANILSSYDKNVISQAVAVVIGILTLILIYFVIRYKERAMLASVLFVGFTALYLLAMRYANITITAASIAGFAFIELFSIFYINKLLSRLKKYNISEETPKTIINKSIMKAIFVLIPIFIIAVVFSLFTSLSVSSLGIALFWGILLFIIYSYICAKTLLLNFEYLFEDK